MGNNKKNVSVDKVAKDLAKMAVVPYVPKALPTKTRKDQKKARKKLLSKELHQKSPHSSKNPVRQVAKNVISQNRMMHVMDKYMERIILAVAAPKEFEPERLGSTFGSYPTAIANPFAVFSTKTTNFFKTELPIFLFRDPRRFLVYPIKPTVAAAGAYCNYRYSYANTPFSLGLTTVPLPGYPLQWLAGEQPHGPVLYPGRSNPGQRSFYYLSAQGGFTFTNINSAGVVINIAFIGFGADGTTFQFQAPIAVANGASLTTGPGAGYWALDIVAVGTPTVFTGSFTLNESNIPIEPVDWYNYIWAHRSLPDMNKADEAAEAIKLYSASLMWTNQASPLNRQGKIAAVQVPQGRDWRNMLSYDSLSKQRGAYISNAVNGYYGFLKPTQSRDIDFIENSIHTGTNFANAWWDMEVPSDFISLVVSVVDVDGQDGYITVAAGFEYRTSDQWRDTESPKISPEIVMKSMSIVAKMQQHHENPLHLSDILGSIRGFFADLWQGVRETVPMVADVASKTATIAMAVAPFL